MKVKLLTTQQAIGLYKRFDYWFEIKPEPITNGMWIIYQDAALLLKEWMIDKVDGDPVKKVRALAIWDFLKSLPTVESDDYPTMFYNTNIDVDNATVEELEQFNEHATRSQNLDEREDIN